MTHSRLPEIFLRVSLAATVFVLVTETKAFAQGGPSDQERLTGEALFKDAKELVDKKDFDAGCPKFDASLKLLPSASTAIRVAQCHEHFGRLAYAWNSYQLALRLNAETVGAQRQKSLADIATKGRDALAPKVPKLRLVLVTQIDASQITLTSNGEALPGEALGTELPVNPGPHEIVVVAPGHARFSRTVEALPGKSTTLEILLVREDASTSPPRIEPPIPVPPPPIPRPNPESPPASPEATTPVWVWIVGGTGLAALGVGVGFLIDSRVAAGKLSDCRDFDGYGICSTTVYTSYEDIVADVDRADTGLAVSLSLISAGVAGLSAALVGFVMTEPPTTTNVDSSWTIAPSLSVDHVGVIVGGRL